MYVVDSEKNLILRPVDITDASDLYEYAQDDQVTKYLSWDSHKNLQDSIMTIKNKFLKQDSILLPVYAIVLQEKMIGTVNIVRRQNNYAYLGYCLNRRYWGQGIMSKVVNKFIQVIRCNTSFKGLYAEVAQENEGSSSVLKKNGFSMVKMIFLNKNNKKVSGKLFELVF